MTSIWWIRRDLRLADNMALTKALVGGAIVPAFILDPTLQNSPYVGEKRLNFLYASLHKLDQALQAKGNRLIIRRGDPVTELTKLQQETDADHIFAHADISPYAIKRDKAIAKKLPLQLEEGVTIRPVDAVLKNDGNPYVVYTPYKKKWKALPLPHERDLLGVVGEIARIQDLKSMNLPDFKESKHFPAGEAEAQCRLTQFIESGDIYSYKKRRDFMADDGTATLSPYLRFGAISPRQAAVAAVQAINNAPDPTARENAMTWLDELVWREFYMQILYHFPRVRAGNFYEKYDSIQWRNNESEFEAWCQGKTGFPIVDAGMRQLNATGWMHNRARMIVASFLVKDLLIDWRWGEKYFMRQLVDGDPAANNGGWQWSAGTGTDAAPYFRIFNPTTNGKKFDPNGDYIRRWVPELAKLSKKFIHDPSKMTPLDQIQAMCRLGKEYPHPIVDHKFARERTLSAYKKAKDT